jgi:S-adenosylmethionine synthetase
MRKKKGGHTKRISRPHKRDVKINSGEKKKKEKRKEEEEEAIFARMLQSILRFTMRFSKMYCEL